MSQGTIQNSNNLYVKDMAVDYATYNEADTTALDVTSASWTEIGALTEASTEASRGSETPPAINVEHDSVVTNEEVSLNMTIQEINPTTLNVLMSGITEIENIAGSLVSGASQAVTATNWTYNDPITVENQNGDLSALSITSITGSVDGLLVSGTDYFTGTAADGKTIITIIDSTTVTTETQTMTIIYDYTPNATVRLHEVETESIGNFMLRYRATMSDGRQIIRYYPRVNYVSGGEIQDKDKDAAEFKDMPFSFIAKLHPAVLYNSKRVLKFTDFISA